MRLAVVLLLAGLILGASALGGCGVRAARTAAAPRLVVVLLDVSGSAQVDRARYSQQLEHIVSTVPPNRRLVLLPLSARTLTAPAAVDLTFPAYNRWTTNAFIHGREMKRLRKAALDAAAGLLAAGNPGPGTAILDGLLQTQDFLAPYPEGSAAVFILSDMVEQGDLLDLYGLETGGIAAAISRVKSAGRLPRLYGATVTVTGLAAAGHLPPGQVLALKQFWTEFFQQAGGRLAGYSPTLSLSWTN